MDLNLIMNHFFKSISKLTPMSGLIIVSEDKIINKN